MGRSRELRGIERRRDANDEKHRPGSCSLSDPRELDCPWRDSNADQYARVGHAGALQRTAQSNSLQTHQRTVRSLATLRVTILRLIRLSPVRTAHRKSW